MVCTISPLRVLVVDDSEDSAMTMALLLKHSGHQAAVAQGGEAALLEAPTFRPDAMFIGLSMPQVDGLTVARRLRQQPEFAETPLIAVSGYVDPEHRAQATAAGFTEFLAKPFGLDTLQAVMQHVVDRLKASRQRRGASRTATAQAAHLQRELRESLSDDWRRVHQPFSVSVELSGISNIITLSDRPAAEELRRWLKAQRCRVGPVFEPEAGRFGFYCYTKRHCIRELIAKHGGFKV